MPETESVAGIEQGVGRRRWRRRQCSRDRAGGQATVMFSPGQGHEDQRQPHDICLVGVDQPREEQCRPSNRPRPGGTVAVLKEASGTHAAGLATARAQQRALPPARPTRHNSVRAKVPARPRAGHQRTPPPGAGCRPPASSGRASNMTRGVTDAPADGCQPHDPSTPSAYCPAEQADGRRIRMTTRTPKRTRPRRHWRRSPRPALRQTKHQTAEHRPGDIANAASTAAVNALIPR